MGRYAEDSSVSTDKSIFEIRNTVCCHGSSEAMHAASSTTILHKAPIQKGSFCSTATYFKVVFASHPVQTRLSLLGMLASPSGYLPWKLA